ncbi:MAG: TAT-variant-translocated molybdopterin oxidoreductase [Akkermansiaceae bacterium]|nr:TAT-variant-translocated molybdopterin oxidoreductase [Akkermansiaceae bacterium]
MKRVWHHPEAPKTGRAYWRSLGELEGAPEFREWLEREFPEGASELARAEDAGDEVSRRKFMSLMGASAALAGVGMTACRRPERHLVPFKEHVEWLVPGKALYYSSAKPRVGGRGCDPLVVTTFDGRPTRVDGNKLHPTVGAGSDAFTQASVLDLYDPDRSRSFRRQQKTLDGVKAVDSDAATFEKDFLAGFRKAKSGQGVAFLLSESSSPTRARLLEEVLKAYPGAAVYEYESLGGAGLAAAEMELFGEGVVQVPQFDKASRILSLDCDFLGMDRLGESPVREFSLGRKVEGNPNGMNRLYAVEPGFTLTGGMADHRLRLSSSQIGKFAVVFASEVAKLTGDALLGGLVAPLVAKIPTAIFNTDWVREAAKDLVGSKGKALVVAGSRHSKEVHLLVAAMNSALGSYGATLATLQTGAKRRPGISELVQQAAEGKVKTLFALGETDPVFDSPGDLKLGEALAKIENVIHLGTRWNLTAQAAQWHVPGAHYLESWGDLRTLSGVLSVVQPMILPLFGGLSEIDFLISLLEAPADPAVKKDPAAPVVVEDSPALKAVKATFAKLPGAVTGDFEKSWNAALRVGFAKGTAHPAAAVSVDASKLAAVGAMALPDMPYQDAIEVNFVPSASTFDGRYANNGWMQEIPDPITKLTWDNAALISQKFSEHFDLKDGDLVELTAGSGESAISITVPVLRTPGQAEFTISLAVGYYGSLASGSVAKGVGTNAAPLQVMAHPLFTQGVTLKKTGFTHQLALTSEHYSMEGRAIVRENTLVAHETALKSEHEAEKKWASHQGMDAHAPENLSFKVGPNYETGEAHSSSLTIQGHEFRVDPDHQWAMTIDLHSCIGCSACTVACQAENNIPIVGKDQVIRGREMAWIRMDRYFTSPFDSQTVSDMGMRFSLDAKTEGDRPGRRRVDDDQVEMISQPLACQQCESAPCETVCPVNATVHTGDGLNAMTYNRCIGTRYCANNCPYKARRFNYFDFNKRPLDELYRGPLASPTGRATTTEQLQKNPNVSVRMRGVIEKCTYCVQRITTAKVAAKAKARDSAGVQVPANSVTTACQDACPAGSIVFGNLKAEGDAILALKDNPRNYQLLNYVGTRPRTSYLARVKNPNMKMPGADRVGTVTAKMH